MKIIKVGMITACLILVFCSIYVSAAEKKALTSRQVEVAEIIYEETKEGYDSYGVLPSTCLVQAFIESTLGEYDNAYVKNNLWGILSNGRLKQYPSLNEGVREYMKVINNGCYPNAPYKDSTLSQIRAILDGGYCQPEGDYFVKAQWTLSNYDFSSYDERMFNERKEEKTREAIREHLDMLKNVNVVGIINLLQKQNFLFRREENEFNGAII